MSQRQLRLTGTYPVPVCHWQTDGGRGHLVSTGRTEHLPFQVSVSVAGHAQISPHRWLVFEGAAPPDAPTVRRVMHQLAGLDPMPEYHHGQERGRPFERLTWQGRRVPTAGGAREVLEIQTCDGRLVWVWAWYVDAAGRLQIAAPLFTLDGPSQVALAALLDRLSPTQQPGAH